MGSSSLVRAGWWTAAAAVVFVLSLIGTTALQESENAGWLDFGPIRTALSATAYYILALGIARQLPDSSGRSLVMLIMSGLVFVIAGYLLYGLMSMFGGDVAGAPDTPDSAIESMLTGVADSAGYAFTGFVILGVLFLTVRLVGSAIRQVATDRETSGQRARAGVSTPHTAPGARRRANRTRFSQPLLVAGIVVGGIGYLLSGFGPFGPVNPSVERLGVLQIAAAVALIAASVLIVLKHRGVVLSANALVTIAAILTVYGLLNATGETAASVPGSQANVEFGARVDAVRASLKTATAIVLIAIIFIGVLWSAVAFLGNRSASRQQRKFAHRLRRVSRQATLLVFVSLITHLLLRADGVIEAFFQESLSHLYVTVLLAETGLIVASAVPRLLTSRSADIGASSLRGTAVMQLLVVFVATLQQTGEFLMGAEYLSSIFPEDADVYSVVQRASWWFLVVPAILVGRSLVRASGQLEGRVEAAIVIQAIAAIFTGVMVWNAGVELAELGVGYRILGAVILGASIGYSLSLMLVLLPNSSETSVLSGLRGIASSAFRSANIGAAIALYLVFARPSVQANLEYLPLFEWLMLTVFAMFVARRTWTGFEQMQPVANAMPMTLPRGWRRHRQRVGTISGDEPHATRLIDSQDAYLRRGDMYEIATRWSIGMAELGADASLIASGLRQIHADADPAATGVGRIAYSSDPDKKSMLARQLAMERMALVSVAGDGKRTKAADRVRATQEHVVKAANDFVNSSDPVPLIAVTITTLWQEGAQRSDISGAVHSLLRYHPARIAWYMRLALRSRAVRRAEMVRKSLADSVVAKIRQPAGVEIW